MAAAVGRLQAMKIATIAAYVVACLSLAALALSCTSPQQATAAQKLAETISAATSDGVVTEDEAKAIQIQMQAFISTPPPVPWAELAVTTIGTLVAGFFGLRYLPNRYVVGPQEAAALDKAAGTA